MSSWAQRAVRAWCGLCLPRAGAHAVCLCASGRPRSRAGRVCSPGGVLHSALTAPGPHGCSRGPSADRLVLEASLPACRAISSPRPHRAVPLCVRVLISSPHKDIRDIGQGLQPCFALRGMSNYSHVRGAGVRASACGFEGSQFSPQQG